MSFLTKLTFNNRLTYFEYPYNDIRVVVLLIFLIKMKKEIVPLKNKNLTTLFF